MVVGRIIGLGFAWAVFACGAAPLWAESELFTATEAPHWGTSRTTPPAETAELWLLNTIEPAAGHAEKPTPAESGKPPESASGKKLGAQPELPRITLGGKPLLTQAEMVMQHTSVSTPEALKKPFFIDMLNQRFKVTTYAHDPHLGLPNAPITIHQFVDLSSPETLKALAQVDTVLAAYASQTQVTHVYAPEAFNQPTNLAAFYGKVAERGGTFWAYRKALIANPTTDPPTLLQTLMQTGATESTTRALILTESRRFYRELDADSLVSKSLGIGKPPVLFVNGIRVGSNGIPLENLKDVMDYITTRLTYHLPEPPQ